MLHQTETNTPRLSALRSEKQPRRPSQKLDTQTLFHAWKNA